MTVFLMLTLLTACDDPYRIDPGQAEPKVVIEGLITNETRTHYVKVSRTKAFYETGATPRIIDAVVSVTDNMGNVYNYEHNPDDTEGFEGYYLSQNTFKGVEGRSYTLTVEVAGVQYTATDKLLPVTAIDSLAVKLNEDEFEDPEDEGRYYEVFFYAKEPQDRVDYYLFKFYRDGDVVRDNLTDIYIAEDEFVGGEIKDIATAGYYAVGELAKVEFYSLSREGFIYYSDLFNVLNNDGGMFGPVPANPRTNLSNGALGYFQTSAVNSKSILVEEPEE